MIGPYQLSSCYNTTIFYHEISAIVNSRSPYSKLKFKGLRPKTLPLAWNKPFHHPFLKSILFWSPQLLHRANDGSRVVPQ